MPNHSDMPGSSTFNPDPLLCSDITRDELPTDMPTLLCPPHRLLELCRTLRDTPTYGFNFLSDIGGVDYLSRNPRFEVVYHLYSLKFNRRIRIKCAVNEGTDIPSLCTIWPCADWHEREAYDMYGLIFTNHPDLKRIYMADDFVGYPLRKDFPVKGYRDELNPNGDPLPPELGGTPGE